MLCDQADCADLAWTQFTHRQLYTSQTVGSRWLCPNRHRHAVAVAAIPSATPVRSPRLSPASLNRPRALFLSPPRFKISAAARSASMASHTQLLLLLLVLSCWLSCCCVVAMEEQLKCSACEAVAAELQRRLEAEMPRQQVDLRHRLDKDGLRYGKIIDWKVSEIRAVELLEDLCESMDDYTLLLSAPSSSSSTAADPEQPQPQEQQQQQPAWVKYKGAGSVTVRRSQRPEKPEEQLRKKQLTTFCGMLLEGHEEEVVEALLTDQFAAEGVTPVLCQQITNRCKGKDYSSSVSGGGAEGVASAEGSSAGAAEVEL